MDLIAVGALIVLLCAAVVASPVLSAASVVAGVCLMTMGQVVEVAGLKLFFFRLVVLVALLRAALGGSFAHLRLTAVDAWVLVGTIGLLISPLGHEKPSAYLVTSLGYVFDTALPYIVFRSTLRTTDDVERLGLFLIFALIALALAMSFEHLTGNNVFARFGGVATDVRQGRIRATGPFDHPILAGSVGATLAPLVAALRQRWGYIAWFGVAACVAVAWASASSGPLLALVAAGFAGALWPVRHWRRAIVITGLAVVLALEIVMKSHVWYLMARIDLVGGSTGYHRALLIDQALAHWSEWWLAGTDYTRHWMPTGVPYSEAHVDFTNHYIGLGVIGGVCALASYAGCLLAALTLVGRTVSRYDTSDARRTRLTWALGSVTFAHLLNSLNVFYVDQSIVLIYLCLACIASLWSMPPSSEATAVTGGSGRLTVRPRRDPRLTRRTITATIRL